jgi:hypothetical protein
MKSLLLLLIPLAFLSCEQEPAHHPEYIFEVRDLGDYLEIEYEYLASPGYEVRYGETEHEVRQERTIRMADNVVLYGCQWSIRQNNIHYIRVTSKDGWVDETDYVE